VEVDGVTIFVHVGASSRSVAGEGASNEGLGCHSWTHEVTMFSVVEWDARQ
jgi:hypothetical protein